MKRRAGTLLIAAALLIGAGQAAEGTRANIPELHATALAGARVDLPEGLRGKVGVLVLGFSQGSRAEVTEWARRLAVDYRESDDVVYYEMAELQSVPRVLRGWVGRKIAAAVPDRAKPRFVLLTDQEAEWKAAAGFSSKDAGDDAYLVLVDERGAVRFRAHGAVNDALYEEVKKQAKNVLAPRS